MQSIWNLLPTYENLTVATVGLYVLAGIFGALVRIAWLDKPLKGFYRNTKGQLHMGSYAEVLTGVAVAIAIDGHPIRAGIGAIFAPWILTAARQTIVKKLPVMFNAAVGSVVSSSNTDTKG